MNSSDIIAICSVVVALVAVGATWHQARLSHRHDKLSLQPFLVWYEAFLQDNQGTTLTLSVENCGQGPAIIKDRWFEIEGGRHTSSLEGSELVEEVAKLLLGLQFEWRIRRSGLVGRHCALPAGANFVVAELYFPGMDRAAVIAAIRSGPEVDFVIEHESLHGERALFTALHGYAPRAVKRVPGPSGPPVDGTPPPPNASRAQSSQEASGVGQTSAPP